jgi:hypothetical protein
MAGEGRPSMSFLYANSKAVYGGAKHRHDDGERAETEGDSFNPHRALSIFCCSMAPAVRPIVVAVRSSQSR